MTAESFYRKKIVEHDSIVFQEEEEQFIVDMIKEYAALKSRSVSDEEIKRYVHKYVFDNQYITRTQTGEDCAKWMRDLLKGGG